MGSAGLRTMASVTPTAVIADAKDPGAKASPTKQTAQRLTRQFVRATKKLADWTTWGLKGGGNISWAVGTSMIALVVPVVIDIMRDQELTDTMVQQEAFEQFKRQQSATVVGGTPPSGLNIPGMPSPPPMSTAPPQ